MQWGPAWQHIISLCFPFFSLPLSPLTSHFHHSGRALPKLQSLSQTVFGRTGFSKRVIPTVFTSQECWTRPIAPRSHSPPFFSPCPLAWEDVNSINRVPTPSGCHLSLANRVPWLEITGRKYLFFWCLREVTWGWWCPSYESHSRWSPPSDCLDF